MTSAKRKVTYSRVSVEEQAEDQRALEQQVTRLKEGITPADVFFDVESGASQTWSERLSEFQSLLDHHHVQLTVLEQGGTRP